MYLATRMTHSLALDRYAPAWSARVTPRGIPRNALLLSAVGPLVAILLAIFTPSTAWLALLSVLIFGIALVWIFIMVTHVRFRQVRDRRVAYVVVHRWTRRSASSADVAAPDHRANAVD